MFFFFSTIIFPSLSFVLLFIVAAFILSQITSEENSNLITTFFQYRNIKKRRIEALNKAKPFLKEYKDILSPITLVNKNCKITFKMKKENKTLIPSVSCFSNIGNAEGKKYYFKAEYYGKTGIDMDIKAHDFWSAICMNFSYSTTYEDLAKICKENFFVFKENYYQSNDKNNVINKKIEKKELLDINSATESEIINLPGINIVIAKKIIQHRETQKGFKNFQEFNSFFKFKPHFSKQLENLICFNPIKKKHKKQKGERILDI